MRYIAKVLLVPLSIGLFASPAMAAPEQANIEAEVNNAGDDSRDIAFYDEFRIDWCCAGINNEGNAYGCVQPGGYMTQCLGICWSCNEGWSNWDGTFGCDGATTQDCPL